MATLPEPTTGCNLGPCLITFIGMVVLFPLEGDESASTITGPDPVLPNRISAAPLLI